MKQIALLLLLIATLTSAARAAPQDVVVKLYREHAWETVIEKPMQAGSLLLNEPASVLARNFTPDQATLIAQDRRGTARTREICKLDFLPIWASQDPDTTQVQIEAQNSPKDVAVRYRFPTDGSEVRLRYRLVSNASSVAHYRHRVFA